MTAQLTLGPLLHHWPREQWRDFYFRIADEAPVDVVYIGEVVCPKRWARQAPYWTRVVDRLERAGKDVVVSTPALVAEPRDIELVRECVATGRTVEINDVAAFEAVEGQAHVVGPHVNVYNEQALHLMGEQGAIRVALPVELPARSLTALSAARGPELEVQVFGRWPLAISARCYHARAYGLTKATCQYACDRDPDGLRVDTIEGAAFLTVNGVQTQSNAYACLLDEIVDMTAQGIGAFRLQPQCADMVRIAQLYRDVIDGGFAPQAALAELGKLVGRAMLANGYYHGAAGADWIASDT